MGTDLDGAFGKEQTPFDVETIADIQKLKNLLLKRGYTIHDIEKIFYRNWIRFLMNAWV
jgi:membrane dipeptidase